MRRVEPGDEKMICWEHCSTVLAEGGHCRRSGSVILKNMQGVRPGGRGDREGGCGIRSLGHMRRQS